MAFFRGVIFAVKKSKFTDEQISFALRQAETGTWVAEVCRKMGISEAAFYNCNKKYGGLGVSGVRRLKQLEAPVFPLLRVPFKATHTS